MPPAADRLAALSNLQRQELESLLLGFDREWGPDVLRRQVSELPSDDEHFRRVAVLELVKIDLERQWKAGNRHSVEDYLQRFPALGTQQTVDSGLLLAEYQVRHQVGSPATLRDFQQRFPERFDQLRQLLEQVGSSVSRPAASVDTSQKVQVSDTKAEAATRFSELPREFGRYRILKQLGEGGMGNVYLAHDTELDRKVAIKVPKSAGGENQQLVDRFYREARAAANLRHANICPVHDVGEVEGTRYICMAYIDGRPLSAYVRRDGRQPQRQVAVAVRKLALALQAAHSQGVVHRDLKPANIMIDREGQPVIMDFGLARQLDKHQDSRLTQQGSVMGSPAYMSPEQVAGEIDQVGPPSDIYSLGVILFELLTGRVPFEGPMTAVLGQIMTQEPPDPSEFRQDLDPRLKQIWRKMTARRIEDRYGSMQEVADAFIEYLKAPVEGESRIDAPDRSAVDGQRDEKSAAALFDIRLPAPPRVTVAERIRGGTLPALLVAVKRLPPKVTWMAGSLAGTFALLLLGIFLVLRTPHGTLKIEIDDPQLSVSIDGNQYTFSQLNDARELKAGEHQFGVRLGEQTIPLGDTVRLSSGEYQGQYKLAITLDGATLTSDRFRIVKGDVRVMTIELTRSPEPHPKDDYAPLAGDKSQGGATPTELGGSAGHAGPAGAETRVNGAERADGNIRNDPPSAAPLGPQTKDGWMELFNGADLSGWTPIGTGNWSVENGILKADGSGRGWLMSDAEYANFELEVEYRLPAGGNSGLFLRAWPEGKVTGAEFLEIQLLDDDDPRHNRAQGFAKTGAIFKTVAPRPAPHIEANRWYQLTIHAEGRRIQVAHDKITIVDANLDDYPKRIEEAPGLARHSGRIGLQMFGGSVEFRSVRLRELGAAVTSSGFVSLFDSKTLDGWMAIGSVASFNVKDGALIVDGPPGSLVYVGEVQNHNFKDFHFKAELMTTKGSNSGIFFRCRALPGGLLKTGYEVQINQTHRDPSKSGGLWGVRDVYQSSVKDGEWYTQEIIVRGKRIITKINGNTVVDYTEPDEVTGSRRLSSGTFAIQSHAARAKVYLRNIVVKPL